MSVCTSVCLSICLFAMPINVKQCSRRFTGWGITSAAECRVHIGFCVRGHLRSQSRRRKISKNRQKIVVDEGERCDAVPAPSGTTSLFARVTTRGIVAFLAIFHAAT